MLTAWTRVRGNTAARSAGIDGRTASQIDALPGGVEVFLTELREQVRSGIFVPLPVRRAMIPKTGGKLRALGIPTVADRVVQAAIKLVLEPIFEAGFSSSSYGFRPERRAHDAIEDICMHAHNGYVQVFEGDIHACFDEISRAALLGRVRDRIKDRRVVALVRAFLKAGVLAEDGFVRDTPDGTPQGGILSPLLANIALGVLDEHFDAKWDAQGSTASARSWHLKKGGASYRLVRYADDFVVLVHGTDSHLHALRDEVEAVLGTVGCACRWPRHTPCTSTRDSTSLGSASSGTPSGEATGDRSTPIPPRRPCFRSGGRSRRSPTSRSPTATPWS